MVSAPALIGPRALGEQTFASPLALAARLIEIAAGRELQLLEQTCWRSPFPFAVVAVFAVTDAAAGAGRETWLGWAAGPGADRIPSLQSALDCAGLAARAA